MYIFIINNIIYYKMSKILFIENNVNFHFEIIESLIVKYNEIIRNEDCKSISIIYLNFNNDLVKLYIKNKYKNLNIIFGVPDRYDYYINGTIYDKEYDNIIKNSNNHFYISHYITKRLESLSNVFFLTPLSNKYIYADLLPFSEYKKKSNIPIYIVQGNLNQNRRDYNILVNILNNNYNYDFKIKLIGCGYLPAELMNYRDKIILKNNLNFIDFHKEFLDGYCILTLTNKNKQPDYYNKKLTSTINYSKAYNLPCIIDNELNNIYNLPNAYVFNIDDQSSLIKVFEKSLNNFYRVM
jgi:hypothetical protein